MKLLKRLIAGLCSVVMIAGMPFVTPELFDSLFSVFTASAAYSVMYLDENGEVKYHDCISLPDPNDVEDPFNFVGNLEDGGWYVVDRDIMASCVYQKTVGGDYNELNIILKDGYTLTGPYYPNIWCDSLNIYAQSTDPATMGSCNIGIPTNDCGIINGGNVSLYKADISNNKFVVNGGCVTTGDSTAVLDYLEVNGGKFSSRAIRCSTRFEINGGTVEAVDSGISAEIININGGTVNAAGGANGAGISVRSNGVLNINNGTVNAAGGANGAGISVESDAFLNINGGAVNAVGGENGAGISSECASFIIRNANVYATGGANAAGIGGSNGKPAGNISIINSNVKAVAGEGCPGGIGAGTGYSEQDGQIVIQDSTVNSYISDGETFDELHNSIANGVSADNILMENSTVNNFSMQYYCGGDGKQYSVKCTFFANQESIDSGWYLVTDDTEIDSRITVNGDVNLIIANGKTLTVNGGIEVPENSSLTVYSQSNEKSKMGRLVVQNVPDGKAGVGGGGNTAFYSCIYDVTGGKGGAAVGGNKGGSGGIVLIGGYAYVTAVGGENAAAIGGGEQSTGGTVICSGGTVSATAGNNVLSGIGAGIDGILDKILIENDSDVNSYACDGTPDTLAAKEVSGVAAENIIFRYSEINGEVVNDEIENGDDEYESNSDSDEMNAFLAAGFKDTEPEGFDESDDISNPFGKTVITSDKLSEMLKLGDAQKLYGHDDVNDKILRQYDSLLADSSIYSSTASGNFDGNREGKEAQYAVIYLNTDNNVYLGTRQAQGYTSKYSDLCLGTKDEFYGSVENDGAYKQYLRIVTGDFDNNGFDEIAVYNPVENGIVVYKLVLFTDNVYTDMNNSWEIAYSIAIENRTPCVSMAAADLDQDGYDDLAYAANGKCTVHDGAKQSMLKDSHVITVDGISNTVLTTADFGGTGQKSLIAAGYYISGSDYKMGVKIFDYDSVSDGYNLTKSVDNLALYAYTLPQVNFNFAYLGRNETTNFFYANSIIYKMTDEGFSQVQDLTEARRSSWPMQGYTAYGDQYFYKDYYDLTPVKDFNPNYGSQLRERYNYNEFDIQTADITGDGKIIIAVTQFYPGRETIDFKSAGNQGTNTYLPWFTNYIELDLNNDAAPSLMSSPENRRNTYVFANTDDDTAYMEYTGRHYCTYTDPQVLAVLASPPYFNDLLNRDDLSGNYAESSTSYGTSKGTGTSESSSSTISAGAFISLETDISVFGYKIGGFGSETSFEYGVTRETEKNSSIEYSVSYSTSSGEDKVVLYSIPREVYEYTIHVLDENGEYKEVTSTVCIPRTPCISQMNLDDYNIAVENYQGLPKLDDNVVTHTIGEPKTYPANTAGFSNPVVFDGNYSAVGFTGTGGGSATSQEIAMSEEKGNSYSTSYSFGEELTVGVGPVLTLGATYGTEEEAGVATITTSGSTYSAEMQDMPIEAKDYCYYMAWKLVTYESKYSYNGKVISFPVVSYLVTDVTQPPELPDDFEQDYVNTTDKQIALTWTYDKYISCFNIYRTYEFPSGTKVLNVGTVAMADSTLLNDGTYEFTFIDENLNPYTEYQYQIEAVGYGTPGNSMLSQQITANTKSAVGYPELSVNGISSDGTLTVYPDTSANVSVVINNPDENRSSIMYQWQKEVDGEWTDISGAVNENYSFINSTFKTEGFYRCRVDSVYYDSTAAQNYYLTAYTEPFEVEFVMRKATSVSGLSVSSENGLPEAEIVLISAKTNHHSAPTGTVTFYIRGTNYDKSYTVNLVVSGDKSSATLSDSTIMDTQLLALPDGVYEVTAVYSGSRIFSSYQSEPAVLLVGDSGYHAVIYNAATNEQTDTITYGDGAYYNVEHYQQNSDGTISKELVSSKNVISDSAVNPAGTYTVSDTNCGSFTYNIVKRPIKVGLTGNTSAIAGDVEGNLPTLTVTDGTLCNSDSISDIAGMTFINESNGQPTTLNNDTLPGSFNVSVYAKENNKYDVSCTSGTFDITAKVYSLITKSTSNGTVQITFPDDYSHDEIIGAALSFTAGTKITYTASPADGYKVSRWVVKSNGESKPYTDTNTITFNMPANEVEVIVYFTPIYYTLTVAEATGGTVLCNSSFTSGSTYPSYTEKTFTAIPDDGYHFAYWQKFTGTKYENVNTDTITVSMKNGNVSLYPIFERDVYTLTIDERLSASYLSDDDNDRTTEDILVSVNSGDKISGDTSVTISAKEDAVISDDEIWTLNGKKIIPTDGQYVFIITEDSEISIIEKENYIGTYQNLQTLLKSAKAIEQGEYSELSFKALQDAVAEAEKLSEANTEEELNTAYDAVADAMKNLKTAKTVVGTSSDPENSGTLTGGGKYAEGELITLTAKAVSGYKFLGWYQDTTLISSDTTCEISVTSETPAEVNYVAKYESNELKNLSVTVGDGTVDYSYCNNTVTGNWNNDITDEEFAKGTYFTVKAIPSDGYTFLYWVNADGRILTESESYSFYLGDDLKLQACYKQTVPDSHYVVFKDMNGKVLWSGDVEINLTDDEGETYYGTVALPAHGTFAGYAFSCWKDSDGNTVSTEETGTVKITEDTVIYADYEAITGLKLTVNGELQSETYAYASLVTVTADETNGEKYFSGWYSGNKRVSDSLEYSFYITDDTSLTAKYEGEDVIVKQPLVNMTMSNRTTLENGKQTVVMNVTWSVPEGYTFVEGGLVRSLVDEYSDKLTLDDVDGVNVKKNVTKLKTAEGTYAYTLTLSTASVGKNLYAKGYITYKNDTTGEVTTIYTDKFTSNAD